jgi:hypothetical protein
MVKVKVNWGVGVGTSPFFSSYCVNIGMGTSWGNPLVTRLIHHVQ